MSGVKDITGQKFGRLTVVKHIGFTEPNKYGRRYAIWKCKCDCGNFVEKTTDVITSEQVKKAAKILSEYKNGKLNLEKRRYIDYNYIEICRYLL